MTFQLGDLVADPRVPMKEALLHREMTGAGREGWAYNVRAVERFDATNAYAWHQTGLGREAQSLAKFPPLRMPYPDLWVEAASHLIPDRARVGALVKDVSSDEPRVRELRREIRAEDPNSVFSDRMLLLSIVTWSERVGLTVSPLFHVVHITEAGEYVGYDVSTGEVGRNHYDMAKFEAEAEQMFMVRPLLFGLSLSNVKGSRTSEPRLLGNPHTKKGKRRTPRNRYRVINIPGSPTEDRPGRGGHRDTARHIVRGHFKHFKNYFGRGPATIWVPHHMRGKREYGVVEKDYSVEPPID